MRYLFRGTPIIELNRYEKEKGVNTKSGSPTSTGGTKNLRKKMQH